MGRTRRIIVSVGALLVLRAVTDGWAIVSSGIQRVLDAVVPLKVELATLGVVLFGEYASATVLFVDPIATGLLYVTVFFTLVRAIYPQSLWTDLDEVDKLPIFKFFISLHVLAVYLVWALVLPLQSEMGIDWFIEEWHGFSPAVWFVIGCPLYFGIFAPVSIGYILSIPEGGLRSKPEPNSAAFAFSRGFSSEEPSPDDIDSTVNFWLNQGVMHAFPAFALGILFIFFEIISPTIEVLLAIGIVATLSPLNAFPPGDLDRYDLEARLAETLRFATWNIKGLISALAIIGGTITGGGVLVLLITIPFSEPVPGQQLVAEWNRAGFVLALLGYTTISTLLWVSLADRLPWFISDWTNRHDTFAGRSTKPTGDLPPRFPVGLGISTIWIVFSLVLPYSTHIAGPVIYTVIWPLCTVVLAVQVISGDNDCPPATDNMTILRSIMLQTALGFLVISASTFQRSIAGMLPISTDILVLPAVAVLLILTLYGIPDLFHWINQRYSITTAEANEVPAGKQAKQRKVRALIYNVLPLLMSILAGIALYVAFGQISLIFVYLLVVWVIFSAAVYRIDANRFQQGNEVDKRTLTVTGFLVSLTAIGLGFAIRFDQYSRQFVSPEVLTVAGHTVIAIGGIGAFIAGSLLFYYRIHGIGTAN